VKRWRLAGAAGAVALAWGWGAWAQNPMAAGPFAAAVVAAEGPFGAPPYDDPASVLGMPSTDFYDPWGGLFGGTTMRRVKLVEPAHDFDPSQTRKLVTTLGEGSLIIVRFEQPITDDPAHPYGLDLLVFGNAWFASSGFADDSADMNTLMLIGGGFAEPMKVSVSPGCTGKPGEDAADWRTWAWYCYENGPYADTAFPTHAYRWNRADSTWSREGMDFTKPVNPVLGPMFESGGLSAADAIDLYAGSGGGTGFDLAESGFALVHYVKVEGQAGFDGGEIDAFSCVRPTVLGDSLCLAPANGNVGSVFHFQEPGNPARNVVRLELSALAGIVVAGVARFEDPSALAALPCRRFEAVDFKVAGVLGSDVPTFDAALVINVGPWYVGGGADLDALAWDGASWTRMPFEFDAGAGTVRLAGLGAGGAFAVVQISPPRLAIQAAGTGFGFQFLPVGGWRHTLERTVDCGSWSSVASLTPTNGEPVALSDAAPLGTRAWYRLRLTRP